MLRSLKLSRMTPMRTLPIRASVENPSVVAAQSLKVWLTQRFAQKQAPEARFVLSSSSQTLDPLPMSS